MRRSQDVTVGHPPGGTRRTVLRGGLVADFGTSNLLRADVALRDGRIDQVSTAGITPGADDAVLDVSGQLVLPGFVNAHSHSYATVSRHVAPGLPLEPWMIHSWANTVGRTADEVRLAATVQAIEALRTGTTTVLDHLGGAVTNLSPALEAYEQVGIRAFVAPMISDVPLPETVGVPRDQWPVEADASAPEFDPSNARELLDAVRELHRQWDGRAGRIRVMLGPSAPQRCTDALLEGCAQLSEDLDVAVHTHLLESRAQADIPPPAGSRTWGDHLRRTGLMTSRLSVAHAVWADPHDLDLLAEAQATIVHNPQSNLQLGSGIGALHAWRRRGVPVALGTDGANCGGSLDMLSSMRLAAILHRPGIADPAEWEDAWSVLRMATQAGAAAVRMPDAGSLEVGARADLCAFDLGGTVYSSGEDPLAGLVYSSYEHCARLVVVGGEVVVRDGRVTRVDEDALLGEVRAIHAHLMRRNDRFNQLATAQTPFLTRLAATAPPNRPLIEFSPPRA